MDDEHVFSMVTQKPPAERKAYLEQVCADKPDQIARIAALIDAHEHPDSFFSSSIIESSETLDHLNSAATETVGSSIGNYKLLQNLGEGGMGTVYMAEQTQPVKRRVALKIIKQGMDSRQFIARFEAERQALAMMDHPNIARVLDAGCTDSGLPYFVMELVKGIPITQYCDKNQLSARQRLELFLPVCLAVQHAHQKGIIHRDLKPSNVLVAMYDDQPVPKVIDFGVAKATNQQLTEKTLFTMVGQIVGTWEYMSPEQAVLNQLDVDTRSDVYSLGVILYELLTGVTPLEGERLRSAALEETLRLIREEEPPKPSTRVSSLGASASTTAAYRRTDAGNLVKTLRGDLDWIVMKALEKNRARRYGTASSLGEDLNRYLHEEPVEARPPSNLYRIGKLIRKNRATAAGIAAAFVAVLLALTGLTYGLMREAAAKAQLRELVVDYEDELTDKAYLAALEGDTRETRRIADKLIEIARQTRPGEPPAVGTRFLVGLANFFSGQVGTSTKDFSKALEDDPNSIAAKSMLAIAHWYGEEPEQYERLIGEIHASRKTADLEPYDQLLYGYAELYRDPSAALEIVTEAIRRRRSILGLAILGGTSSHVAAHSGDPRLLNEALAAMRQAESELPNNRFVLMGGLAARHFGIACFDHLDEELTAEGNAIAKQLGDPDDFPVAQAVRGEYYWITGQKEKSLDNWKKAAGTGEFYLHPTGMLYMEGREREARDFLKSCESSHPLKHVAMAYLQVGDPTQTDGILALCSELAEHDSFLVRLEALQLLLLLGKPELAAEKAEEVLRVAPELKFPMRIYHHRLRYINGDLTEKELLQTCRGRLKVIQQCFAYHQIGMKKLSQGDRDGAAESFEMCRDTNHTFPEYFWAAGFEKRLKSDPAWPTWIK